jgi:hypothetical protein
MISLWKDDVNIDRPKLQELSRKLYEIDPEQRLQITLTVFKNEPYRGLDSFYLSTIRVRCTNAGRQKGEPREVEFMHHVQCLEGTCVGSGNRIKCYRKVVADTEIIQNLIKDYSEFGNVTVNRNDLPFFPLDHELCNSIIIDQKGNYLDNNGNIIKSFNSYEEALAALKTYKK